MATLEERVAALEALLSARGVGDSYQPAFMTVEPDGQIAFDFTGHITAEGIDLVASQGSAGTDPTDRIIRWMRADESSEVGYAVGRESVSVSSPPFLDNTMDLVVVNRDFPGTAMDLEMLAQAVGGPLTARLLMEFSDTIPSDNFNHRILDNDRTSDFMLARGCLAFLFSAAATNIANTATAQVNLGSVVYDVTDVRGSSAGTMETQRVGNVFTARREGIYRMTAIGFGPTAGFGFTTNIRQNGAAVRSLGPNTIMNGMDITRDLVLAVGDTVDITITNSTGAAGNFQAWLMGYRIGSTTFKE